jgi:hypothetical protein
MSSFEAVIDRMKQEGDLNRNSGTNSIKSLKEKLDSSNIILSNILNALKKNVVGGTSSTPLSRLVSQQPLQKEGATSELSKESSIFKLLSAATKFQAMRPIKALGDTASSIGSSLKEKFGINSFQKAFSDRLENLKSSLFQFAGGKEEETSSDIEETLSENLSSDGPIVSAIETQTTHIKELVGLFKDFIFQGRQSELERNDLESEAQSPDPEQPTIVEEEESDGKSGILSSLMKFGSVIGAILPGLGTLKNVIQGILAISGIKMILDAAGVALTAGAGLGKTLIKTLLMNALPYIFNPVVLGLLGGAALAYLINMLLTSEGVGAEAMDNMEKKNLNNATAANDEATAKAKEELAKTGKVSNQTKQALSETEYEKNFYQEKQDARERVLKLSQEEFKAAMSHPRKGPKKRVYNWSIRGHLLIAGQHDLGRS